MPTMTQKYALLKSLQNNGENIPNQSRSGKYPPNRIDNSIVKIHNVSKLVNISNSDKPSHLTNSDSLNIVALMLSFPTAGFLLIQFFLVIFGTTAKIQQQFIDFLCVYLLIMFFEWRYTRICRHEFNLFCNVKSSSSCSGWKSSRIVEGFSL